MWTFVIIYHYQPQSHLSMSSYPKGTPEAIWHWKPSPGGSHGVTWPGSNMAARDHQPPGAISPLGRGTWQGMKAVPGTEAITGARMPWSGRGLLSSWLPRKEHFPGPHQENVPTQGVRRKRSPKMSTDFETLLIWEQGWTDSETEIKF